MGQFSVVDRLRRKCQLMQLERELLHAPKPKFEPLSAEDRDAMESLHFTGTGGVAAESADIQYHGGLFHRGEW